MQNDDIAYYCITTKYDRGKLGFFRIFKINF